MKENKDNYIMEYCLENNIKVINIRRVKKSNRTRIVLTCLCKECGRRYDIRWTSLKQQLYKGLCTSCAHRKTQEHRMLTVDDVVKRFTDVGYKVLTPANKIKPRGKRSIYFTPLEIANKYGDVYTTNCNNFCCNLEYYKELSNCDKRNEILKNESRLEYKVRKFLDSQDIPYKQQFRFMDCRGEKYPLPFDFCLYYKDDKHRMLIEVDGAQHFRADSLWADSFKMIQKNDRRKNYYCQSHNIPLLRLRYDEIDSKDDKYKQIILDFIHNNW